MKISVALAAYNGEKYIKEQIESILCQLSENDEIIVSDDNPFKATKSVIDSIADPRIKYFAGEGKGVVRNFENAIKRCSGDVIFLADQDDVWMPDKVGSMLAEFEKGADVILHHASVTDAKLNITEPSYFAVHGSGASFSKNLLRNTFVGCCMAFTKEIASECVPFPGDIAMHDWWIALASIKRGRKVVILDKPLILWRRHGENVTGSATSIKQKIRWRINMISSLKKI